MPRSSFAGIIGRRWCCRHEARSCRALTRNSGNCSRKEFQIRSTLIERRSFGPAFVFVDEVHVSDAQGMEDGGVEVVNVETVFHSVEAEFIGRANDLTAFDAAAGHPHG